jgi:hypothetical protein
MVNGAVRDAVGSPEPPSLATALRYARPPADGEIVACMVSESDPPELTPIGSVQFSDESQVHPGPDALSSTKPNDGWNVILVGPGRSCEVRLLTTAWNVTESPGFGVWVLGVRSTWSGPEPASVTTGVVRTALLFWVFESEALVTFPEMLTMLGCAFAGIGIATLRSGRLDPAFSEVVLVQVIELLHVQPLPLAVAPEYGLVSRTVIGTVDAPVPLFVTLAMKLSSLPAESAPGLLRLRVRSTGSPPIAPEAVDVLFGAFVSEPFVREVDTV